MAQVFRSTVNWYPNPKNVTPYIDGEGAQVNTCKIQTWNNYSVLVAFAPCLLIIAAFAALFIYYSDWSIIIKLSLFQGKKGYCTAMIRFWGFFHRLYFLFLIFLVANERKAKCVHYLNIFIVNSAKDWLQVQPPLKIRVVNYKVYIAYDTYICKRLYE